MLAVVNQELREIKDRLGFAVNEFLAEAGPQAQRDVEVIRSMPGTGLNLIASLIAYSWEAIEDRSRKPIRSLGGIAPVTVQSGGLRRALGAEVRQRRACNDTLRMALHHWGRLAMIHDPTSKAKYAQLRARGHTYGRAIRQLVDGLLSVMCSMLRHGTVYRPSPAVAA